MLTPPSPRKLEDLRAGEQLFVGRGVSTVIADMDFETYSPAGHVFNAVKNKWGKLPNEKKSGLQTVGAAIYTEHPDAEVLSLAYDLKDGLGKRHWYPRRIEGFSDNRSLRDLFDHIRAGKLIEAWNVGFEYWVWMNICVRRYNFPPLDPQQLRCAMAKARAFALPGDLEKAGEVLNLKHKKDKEGKRLINKFTVPRNPTNDDPRLRTLPEHDPEDIQRFYNYNIRDIEAEAEASSLTPDLPPDELEFWLCDQAINRRGLQIDVPSVKNCIKIFERACIKYNQRLSQITNGAVPTATKTESIRKWLREVHNIKTPNLKAATVEKLLEDSLPPPAREVVLIRSRMGSAAVKKLYKMLNRTTRQGRIHDLFIYHGARTGRAAGSNLQAQNLPKGGPNTNHCNCGRYYGAEFNSCPWCGAAQHFAKKKEWSFNAATDALTTLNTGNLDIVEYIWGDAVDAIYGCIRSLVIAKDGHEFICSDYSAIEAVGLAAIAGETWRLEVFATHGKIYETSASKICGIPFEEFERYKKETGQHHPLRNSMGKTGELASGYQGGWRAWVRFGGDKFLTEQEMKDAVKVWRRENPKIVELWGGQQRNWKDELYGVEGAAINAVLNPGIEFTTHGISYIVKQDILYCRLLSGRYIAYHRPRLGPGKWSQYSLSFEGWNTNPEGGKKVRAWIRMDTYGGKLVENIVQATCRDILAYAIINLEYAGYPVVLHVHDEIVCEIPKGFGSIEEFERVMSTMPFFAKDWPIRATGGWRGERYRKD